MKHKRIQYQTQNHIPKENPEKKPQTSAAIHLNPFVRRFWPLLTTPVFTLLYAPVNRYVMLPKLGSGKPYVDMNGDLIESYFSANSAALILFWLLLAVTECLVIRSLHSCKGIIKLLFHFFCILMNLAGGFLFLELTLWG